MPGSTHKAPVEQSTLTAIGAAVFAVSLAAGMLLWLRFGEAVYIERILGAIASCF